MGFDVKSLDEYLQEDETRRKAVEPWAIGKRLWVYAQVPNCIDKRNLREQDGDAVVDEHGVVLPALQPNHIKGHGGFCNVIEHNAKDLVPWDAPPDWPGVVAVIHPAAWATTGEVLCEALAKRFNKTVHVFWHGAKWYLVFVGPPGNYRSTIEQAEYDKDCKNEPCQYDDGGLYCTGNCQWWAIVSPTGQWKNLAAS